MHPAKCYQLTRPLHQCPCFTKVWTFKLRLVVLIRAKVQLLGWDFSHHPIISQMYHVAFPAFGHRNLERYTIIQPKYVIYHAILKQCLGVFKWFFFPLLAINHFLSVSLFLFSQTHYIFGCCLALVLISTCQKPSSLLWQLVWDQL